jgi:hypothetical protein
VKGHHSFPSYLPRSIFIPLISPTFVRAFGLVTLGRVLSYHMGRRAKGPKGKISWQELKTNIETFEMLRLGILEKEVKIFSVRKGDP